MAPDAVSCRCGGQIFDVSADEFGSAVEGEAIDLVARFSRCPKSSIPGVVELADDERSGEGSASLGSVGQAELFATEEHIS